MSNAISKQAAINVLSAWTVLEVLSPQTFTKEVDLVEGNDPRAIIHLRGKQMPWENGGEKVKPGNQIFYQVVIGKLDFKKCLDELHAQYPDKRFERPTSSKKSAIIAALTVDQYGRLLQGYGSLSVSSFAWGLRSALDHEIEKLFGWRNAEQHQQDSLREILEKDELEPRPLTAQNLEEAYRYLVQTFKLPSDLVINERFAIKKEQRSTNPPPASLILNSFYLDDLAAAQLAIKDGTAADGLLRYLGLKLPSSRQDILKDSVALRKMLAPSKMPRARWPSGRAHSLALLQQAAVNSAMSMSKSEGIFAINGPPGTGKTTLLRDVVASVLCERAEAMLEFNDPADAFTYANHNVSFGSGGSGGGFSVYKLDKRLRGFEMVIASSNNGAVENISTELPALKNISSQFDSLRYFDTFSDALLGEKTWGIISAVMGNSKNRSKFWGTFFHDHDHGLGNYLATAHGAGKPWIETLDDDPRRPEIVTKHDQPGDRKEALVRWQRARDNFKSARDKCQGRIANLEAVKRSVDELDRFEESLSKPAEILLQEIDCLISQLDHSIAKYSEIGEQATKLSRTTDDAAIFVARQDSLLAECDSAKLRVYNDISKFNDLISSLNAQISVHEKRKLHRYLFAVLDYIKFPLVVWWKAKRLRLLKRGDELTRTYGKLLEKRHKLEREHGPMLEQRGKMLQDLEESRTKRDEYLKKHSGSLKKYGASVKERDAALLERDKLRYGCELKRKVAESTKPLGSSAIDNRFFAKSHKDIHLTAPWQDDEICKLRSRVFIAAINLSKAFVDAAAQQLRYNISSLEILNKNNRQLSSKERSLMGDLWSSFFLVVPSISTTFASMHNMFKHTSKNAFGWLMIDEAGQAAPQAAVGAIMRAKRIIVTGDPLQLEPVVELPVPATKRVFRCFKADADRFNAPRASVQTLADAANTYFANFKTDNDGREVGFPLLVHRRCEDLMFTVSNSIAYNNLMVKAKKSNPSPIRDCLGNSRWFDIHGSSTQDKWSPAEGEQVLELLKLMRRSRIEPNLYILSPFRSVANALRSMLKETSIMDGWANDDWIKKRVGTVHTAQGREAETVILVLGAPLYEHGGARKWAGATPNLLNVSVTRAKEVIYVIGNREAWKTAGVFATLTSMIEHSALSERGAQRQDTPMPLHL